MIAAAVLLAAAMQAAQPAPADVSAALKAASPTASAECAKGDGKEVVVCGRSSQRFRIDPDVLDASRARNAVPAKPPVSAEASPSSGCVGPNACGGDYLPVVGMALTALKAAELAVEGEDWRDAFRTKPDEYRLYQQSQDKKASGHVSIGIVASH